ncbi:hypothetical protein Mapa_001382 [Marchantia paleacea]|nr:hypothetical protein Mapa_001382 [Marchantia paleacea]
MARIPHLSLTRVKSRTLGRSEKQIDMRSTDQNNSTHKDTAQEGRLQDFIRK